MINPIERFVPWCESELASLQRQLELLESGVMTTGEKRLGPPSVITDTTAETIKEVRRKITELETLLT